MLFWIAKHFGFEGLLNLIRYQTFRTGAAVATALVIGLIIGPPLHRLVAGAAGQGAADPRRRPADASGQARQRRRWAG